MFKKLIDMHTHTDNSPDAEHSGMVLCEHAVRKKLRGIAFTDHCEVDNYYSDHYDRIVKQSLFEIYKAREAFTGSLVICVGIELGQPSSDFILANRILNTYSFDVVLASLHAVKGEKDFYFLDYSNYDVNELLEKYFTELHSIVQWGKFDILAHLTYPLRYITGVHKIEVDMKRYSDIIDSILSLLAQKGKALEINTSGLRKEIGETSPTIDIVKRFRELGGEYITIGSDAHNFHEVGEGLIDGYQLAYDAGFRESVLFQNHEPISISFI